MPRDAFRVLRRDTSATRFSSDTDASDATAPEPDREQGWDCDGCIVGRGGTVVGVFVGRGGTAMGV